MGVMNSVMWSLIGVLCLVTLCLGYSNISSVCGGDCGSTNVEPDTAPETVPETVGENTGSADVKLVTLYHDDGNFNFKGAAGHMLSLRDSNSANKVTYSELLSFLKADKTDENIYCDTFECGDFAEKLQQNATNAGLKCGFVEVNFVESGTEHAGNVFSTIDRGYVFVDDSGGVDAFVKIEQLSDYTPYTDDGSYIFEPVGMIDHVTIWWSDWDSDKYC